MLKSNNNFNESFLTLFFIAYQLPFRASWRAGNFLLQLCLCLRKICGRACSCTRLFLTCGSHFFCSLWICPCYNLLRWHPWPYPYSSLWHL
ncbi:hypothetical protein PG_1152 [Porphyromonas gingivalis W83]|uniref:Uncharacterized protein n=1 Tax=Porphyromonas gingivalis (strain ATCC BAA-308 / W83) TaxID=242619 RepID=Q7MVC1_PORGI|nr:hypothetical protein PG_1152 [Porphyromonas gingivalis W83]